MPTTLFIRASAVLRPRPKGSRRLEAVEQRLQLGPNNAPGHAPPVLQKGERRLRYCGKIFAKRKEVMEETPIRPSAVSVGPRPTKSASWWRSLGALVFALVNAIATGGPAHCQLACTGLGLSNPCVPGGGSTKTDCFLELAPRPVPPRRKDLRPKNQLVCYEGDPACDIDGPNNGGCTMQASICINNHDPRFSLCVPSSVASCDVLAPPRGSSDPNRFLLEAQCQAVVDSGTPDLCSAPVPLQVPLNPRGGTGQRTIRLRVSDATGARDSDVLKLRCKKSSCGDGRIQSDHEQCDDGNRTNGDGCDAGCHLEDGWACAGAPSVCTRLTVTPTPAHTSTSTARPGATPTSTPDSCCSTASPTRTPTPTPSPTPSATASREFIPPAGQTALFEDDFTTSISTSNWNVGWYGNGTTDITKGANSSETACWNPANISTSNSQLHLVLRHQYCTTTATDASIQTFPWTGAGITTRHTFNTSSATVHAEAKIQLPALNGAYSDWPAFWLTGVQECWPQHGELDIAEVSTTDLSAHTHYGTTCGDTSKNTSVIATLNDANFHVYSADASPAAGGSCSSPYRYEQVTYKRDGTVIGTHTQCIDLTGGWMVVVNLSCGDKPGDLNGGPCVDGSQMDVEYVAVSQP